MSYYVIPDYWIEGYAVGDAVNFSAIATELSNANLSAGITTNAVCFVDAESSMSFSIDFSVYISATSEASSRLQVSSYQTHSGSLLVESNGIMTSSFRLKWDFESEPSDAWIDIDESSDIWTNVSESTNTWS